MKRRDFIKAGASASLTLGLTSTLSSRPALADTPTIIIRDVLMKPEALTVKVGQAILIIDQDNASHVIYSETKDMEIKVKIPAMGRGEVVFAKAGIATLECAQHATEIAQITVLPA